MVLGVRSLNAFFVSPTSRVVLGEFAEMMMFCHRNYGMIFGYNYKTCPNAWNQMVTVPWYCCDPSMQICQEKMFNFDNVFITKVKSDRKKHWPNFNLCLRHHNCTCSHEQWARFDFWDVWVFQHVNFEPGRSPWWSLGGTPGFQWMEPRHPIRQLAQWRRSCASALKDSNESMVVINCRCSIWISIWWHPTTFQK